MDPASKARLAQQAIRRHELHVAGGLRRRDFIGGGLVLALGVPPLLQGCGGSDDDEIAPRPTHRRTLFFNLAHEQHAGKTYSITGGGNRVFLTPVASAPHVLRREREGNAFLRAVPDSQITHHVEDVPFASDTPTLCYVSSELDTTAGTWQMSSVQLYIPPEGATRAYAEARKKTPSGPLPMSAKRKRYAIAAALSEQDLRDERVLFDSASHAATLIGCHPDLMSLEPVSAHIVHSNHVDQDINVQLLDRKLSDPQQPYGAALPQASAGQPNPSGWAILKTVPADESGTPLKNVNGQHAGRIQYQPSLHPDLLGLVRAGMADSIPDVKDDEALGADITGLSPSQISDVTTRLSGALWMRRDGVTRVGHGLAAKPGAVAASSARMTLTQQNGQPGYQVEADVSTAGSAPKVSLTLLNFFLEFRGVYLQFLDGDTVLNLADIPEYVAGTIVAAHDKISDTQQEMFVSMIGPVFTVLAIPTAPGFIQPSFTVPQRATTVRILSSTMSMQGGGAPATQPPPFQGGNVYPQTVLGGAIMTGVFNYGVTALLCAAGAGPFIPALYKAVVIPFLQALTLELINTVSLALNPNGDKSLVGLLSTPSFWENQALIIAKVLVTKAVGEGLKALTGWIAGQITLGTAEDSIPIAGEMMQAISIAVGVASLAETTAELALTPWTYVDDLVFTHDLTVTLKPDPGDDTFPKDADGYTVTAMFDDGTPHVQTFALAAPVPGTLPPIVFSGVPRGGGVNVSVAFVQEAIFPGEPDILLGKGTTGRVDNTVDAYTLTIEEIAFPIGSTTRYQHRQKTALDANGNHKWIAATAPTVNASNSPCDLAGTACGFRGISVRQGTAAAKGYIGYAWQSQNAGTNLPSCQSGAQIDQLANLNTNPGTDGSGAQAGYANGACGFAVPGVKVAYNLLSNGQANFYLDTTDPTAPIVRQVVLEPTPAFDDPTGGRAWGVLNLSSDTLLLHPAGHLVSINGDNHRIETHRLPKTFMADADARWKLLAQVKSGQGTRPGLIDTPAAAAVSADGVILVLEQGNNRIQALDLGANPVQHFTKQTAAGASPYSLTLAQTDPMQGWTYLDLAVEYTGYVYVLSYNTNTFEYRLDLYHPSQTDGNPIATTRAIYAANIAVDFWRNLYTLNYELLQLPGNNPAPLTEPSVSLWTPCAVGQTC